MKFRILFFLFFFGLIGLTTTSFAQTIEEVITVYQGAWEDVQVPGGVGSPQENTLATDGTVEFVSVINNSWKFRYTPNPGFLGYDEFSYNVVTSPFSQITYSYQMKVLASIVETQDDFVHLTSDDEVVIDILSNDETTSSNLTITLAQVLKGAAVVNEDNTISYTPSSDNDDPDYIIYTVSDNLNTISSSTVYISQETSLNEELTIKDYTIASGKSQYIILPNEDFTLNNEEYSFGTVEEVNVFVFKYTAFTDAEGEEELNFTDSEGNTFQASVSIIEKYYDEGYVRDDVFYSAANTSIEFDVTLNDQDDQYVIADYSEDLIHQGEGVFSYTPTPYFTGVKEFFYTADDGFTEETGSIELVINNYKPTNYFEYSLATPENQPRIIEYDVPLGTEYFEIASLPSFGSVEIFTEDESVDVGCEEGLQKVFVVYTPDNDYLGADDLTIRYCASDNNICNDVSITLDVVANEIDDCICVDDCVWPGDANGDGKVSITDVLSIGRFIGKGGSARDDSPFGNTYEGVSVDNWLDTQANGKNIKHADANGDGIITVADLDVVVDNYGEVNSIISTDVLGIKNLPFTLTMDIPADVEAGDEVKLFVSIGNEAYPAIDIQGVAFAINLLSTFVDSSTVEVKYEEDGYLVSNAPYVGVTYQPVDGIIHTAGLKSNSTGATGFGLVATVSFIVESAEGFKEKFKYSRSSSDNAKDNIVTISATDIVIEDSRGYKYALPNTSVDIALNDGEDSKETIDQLEVYPNPSSDLITISSEDRAIIESIKIFSIEGRLVKSINPVNSIETQIDVSDIKAGLYIIEASGKRNTYSTKVIKR